MRKDLELTCTCHCVKVVLSQLDFDDDEDSYILQAYESSFYARQSKVKDYFKRLWCALIGKDYHLYEAVISHEEFDKLSKWITDEADLPAGE